MQINDDQVGRSVEETLRLLKAFQFADSHEGNYLSAVLPCTNSTLLIFTSMLLSGEACPASWTPGADTIKTNPEGSREYFKSHYSS